jgi:glutamate N-acetyltransferase / amino-acid N-acetyltransferase
MDTEPEIVPGGGITTPRGFKAGATGANIKNFKQNRLDLGILFSDAPSAAAAVFTTNKFQAASVLLNKERIKNGTARVVVMNSGCANACTGEQGMKDAVEMTDVAAKHTGVRPEEVLSASTGVIGTMLPMERIRNGINRIILTEEGGHDLARAIMTTDTVHKEIALKTGDYIIGGIAKGSGMIHPNMATLLCFLTTDAAVNIDFLKAALKEAVDMSFNMVSVDGDNSTNDTVLIMANGMTRSKAITKGSEEAGVFQRGLNKACVFLAKAIARDGEGAKRLIEVKVRGAKTTGDARLTARTIVSSSLFKAAVYGADPNWGRVVAAAGRSGAEMVPDKIELEIGGTSLVQHGEPVHFDREKVVAHMRGDEVLVDLNLNLGKGMATAWGCDLTEEYVKINAEYTT